ncbi:hypothetical protein DBR42_16440, partial [Pelomonas sp. HMWF004]
ASTISSALNSGTSVTVDTTSSPSGGITGVSGDGDIIVNSAISKTSGGDATLTLRAHQNVNLTAGISSTQGRLNLVLWANQDASAGGSVWLQNAPINTNGGHFWMGGSATNGGSATWNGLTVGNGYSSSNITSFSDTGSIEGALLRNSNVTTQGGNVTILGRNDVISGTLTRWGLLLENSDISTGTGSIELIGNMTNLTGASPALRGVELNGSDLTTTTGNISLSGFRQGWNSNGESVRIINSAIRSSGTSGGNITVIGRQDDFDDGTSYQTGLLLYANGANSLVEIKTDSGNISIEGTNRSTTRDLSYGIWGYTAQPTFQDSNHPVINIVSKTGSVTIEGNALPNSNSAARGIMLTAGDYGKINIGFDGTNAYSGDINIRASSWDQQFVAPGYLSMRGAGALTIEPLLSTGFRIGSATAHGFTLDGGYSIGSTHSSVNLGGSSTNTGNTGSITIATPLTAVDGVSLYGGGIAINSAVTASATGGRVTLTSAGNVTQSAAVTSPNLLLLGSGSFSLLNTGNDVATLAAGSTTTAVSSLQYADRGALTIGTVGSSSGIRASGNISVASGAVVAGDLTLSQSLLTAST